MAERRMFEKSIIDSDLFLDMPVSAQLLYFRLLANSDNDFMLDNPTEIQKRMGSNDADFNRLINNKFIFEVL